LTIACAACCGLCPPRARPRRTGCRIRHIAGRSGRSVPPRALAGHFTASCWLVSADGQRLLLTHHRKLQRWLQLGGHADGDRDLAQVALKEAEEESGLSGLVLEDPAIFDLDKHWIPERKDVPGHWHYDVRFVIRRWVAKPSCSARNRWTWPGGR
jgi:8-oxo-dGTP pyrophosphatase MutT (NUDIX family)